MQQHTEPRRFGHPFLRGEIWWVRYRTGGREFRESTRSRSLRVAERLLARREAELGLGVFVEPATKRTTFETLAQLVRTDYVVNGRRSAARLENSLQRLSAAFAGMRALSITRDKLDAYVADRLKAGAAASTVRNELNALGRAFRLAEEAGRVAKVPTFPTIELHNVRQGFFEEADLRALLPELPAPLRPLIEFLHLTGWRSGEALGLTWAGVDFANGTLRLEPETTKNAQGRVFPFAAWPALRTLLERQRALTRRVERRLGQVVSHVFHRWDKAIRDFHKTWDAAIERAAYRGDGPLRQLVRPGLLGRLVHDLRRTAVRRLERCGVSRSVAMQLTGHKTESVYRRYAIVAEQDLREGVAKLATPLRAIGGTTGAQSGGSARA